MVLIIVKPNIALCYSMTPFLQGHSASLVQNLTLKISHNFVKPLFLNPSIYYQQGFSLDIKI